MKNIVFLQHTFVFTYYIHRIHFYFKSSDKIFNYNITIPIHMLIHFYTIIALFMCFFINHNFLKTFTHIKQLLLHLYQYFCIFDFKKFL